MRLFTKFWISIVGVTLTVLLLAVSINTIMLYRAESDAALTVLEEQAGTISTMINNDMPPRDVYANMSRFCLAQGAASILFDRALPENSPSCYASAALQTRLEQGESVYREAVAHGEALITSLPEEGNASRALLLYGSAMPDGRYLLLACHAATFSGVLLGQTRTILTILLVSLLLTTLLSGLLARTIVHPLSDIEYASRQSAAGNFEVSVEERGGDELESVAHAINTMSRQLKRSDSFKNEIISNVSHNLKTPIAAILTYTELLKSLNDLDAERQRQFVDVIEQRAQTLEGMVKSLIQLSKLQTGSDHIRWEVVDLEELCREQLLTFEVLADKKGLQLVLHCPEEIPAVISDYEKLSTVIGNLLSNAVKHTGTGGRVELSLAREGRATLVTVSDNGEGIHPDDLPHIWERFYKSPHSRISKSEGSGLGMHIVKTLLLLLEYPHDIVSTEGEGTTVMVTIPDLDHPPAAGEERR